MGAIDDLLKKSSLGTTTTNSGSAIDNLIKQRSTTTTSPTPINLTNQNFSISNSTPQQTNLNINPIDMAVGTGQAIARTVGSVGTTAGNIPTQIINAIPGVQKQPLPFNQSIPTTGSPITSAIFGGQPIDTVQQRIKNVQTSITPNVGPSVAQLTSPSLVFLGIAMDLSGWGGGKAVKSFASGEVPELFFKTIAKDSNPTTIIETLKGVGFNIDDAIKLAPDLASAKTSQGVKDVFLGFEKASTEGAIAKIAISKNENEISTVLAQNTKIPADRIPVVSKALVGVKDPKIIERAIDAVTPKPAEVLATKEAHVEILKNQIAENPLGSKPNDRLLFNAREGQTISVADAKSPAQIRYIEDRMAEAGYTDPQKFLDDYQKLQEQKAQVRQIQAEIKSLRDEVKKIGEPSIIEKSTPIPKSELAKESPALNYIEQIKNDNNYKITKAITGGDEDRALARIFQQRIDDGKVPQNVLDDFYSKTPAANDMETGQILYPKNGIRGTHIMNFYDNPTITKILDKINKPSPKKYSSEGIPLSTKKIEARLAKKGISVPQSVAQTTPPVQGTQGEVRSIEKMAEQAQAIMSGNEIPVGIPLKEIIAKTITPVTEKVHIIDTFMTTPSKVMEKIGFGEEAKDLRRAADSIMKELPKHIGKDGKINEWLKELGTNESQTRVFRFLDGQAVDLTEVENKVANEIRKYLENWADRLNLPEDNRITHYITRLFEPELIKKEFDEDLAKIIAGKIPGQVYDPFLQKRLGAKGYKENLGEALDAYVKRAIRKVYMDPVLEKIKDKTGSSLATSKIEKSQFEYIQKYLNNINMRPSELDESIDNFIKSLPLVGYKLGQRPVANLSRFLRQTTYRGMLGLNLSSALRNLSQGLNTYAVLGEKYTVIGYSKLFSPEAHAEAVREGVLGAGVIDDRVLSSGKKALQMFDKTLYSFFQAAEHINRGAAYFGAKAKYYAEHTAIKDGVEVMPQDIEKKAIEYAKEVVRQTQFVFDKVDTPVGMSGDIVKTLFQFQSYTTKQIEFLGGMAKKAVSGDEKAKNFIGLLRYALGGLIFTSTIGAAFGMKPSDLLPWYRFDVPPSLKTPVETVKALLGTNDKYGNARDTSKKISDVAATLPGLIPAGVQIKKSLQGYSAVQQGKSITKSGASQFPVGGSKLKDAQAILFGKYATAAAQDYYNNQTSYAEAKYKELQASKTPREDLAKIIKEDPALAKAIANVIRKEKLGITKEDDKLLSLGVANKARAMQVYKNYKALNTKEEQKALISDYITKKILTEDVAKQFTEMLKNPPKETSAFKTIINTIFGIKTANAAEIPNQTYWIRNNPIDDRDLNEARAVLFGEISNRSSDKQMLEAQTILNTAFNRMEEYAKRGNPKTLTEVLQMDNQYQAYQGKQYNKYKSGELDVLDQRKVDSINAMIAKVQDGTFQNNIGDSVFYIHKPDGRIVVSNKKLFK